MNSSDSFLKQIASSCFQNFGEQSDSLTIIFPNKRAGLFFRKYLAELTDKPIWSPTILSIEEFVISLSKVKPADQNRLLFALYTIYKSKISKAETFDNFYQWGEMILSDFNDIDNYLIDSEHIFRIVKSQKELDEAFYYLPEEDQKTIQSFWASFLPKPTKSQNDFLRTWKILNVLYEEFNELLSQKKISYKGKIYREVAESIETIDSESTDNAYWFAGFNALTKVEEKIIKYFVREKNAEIFWDIDSYYFDDDIQEAGYFFRKYAEDSVLSESIKRDVTNRIGVRPQNITNYSVALSMGQVKAVGEKLSQLSNREDFLAEKTVVVLPDENLLLPVLNSIPETIDQVNVTMGYPLGNSNYFSFVELLLDLINSQPNAAEGQYFKSRLIISILNHPLYEVFFQHSTSEFVTDTISKNTSFIHSDQLSTALPGLYDLIKRKEKTIDLLSMLGGLLIGIDKKNLTIIDQAVIHELHELIKNIQRSMEEFDLQIDFKSLYRLFTRLGNTKVPFSGEPLSGLQIMGILETRNLDFDHVFILDMNEGIWPKDSSNSSFIPYNIRRAFDLPVVEHQDAIQSYLFYRLLHHSNTMDIFHNNVSEFNHSGELSRYVMQIQMESNLKIDQRLISNSISPQTIKPITIQKTQNVLDVLRRYHSNSDGSSRLSPSAINTFLDCKLKFYFKYIERIKEKQELNEALDPAAFGNLLHHTMEFFYEGLISKKESNLIERDDLESSQDQLQIAIKKAFITENQDLNEDASHNGQQVIASKVIEKLALQIINNDKGYVPFEIHALEAGGEDRYILDLPIKIDGEEITIGLKGVIDRIDKKDETVRILDYKSGGDERNFPSIESLFDRDINKRNKAAMQVLLYCLFYKQNTNDSNEKIVPGVFNSKDLFSPDFNTNIRQGRNNVIDNFSTVEDEYIDHLRAMLEDLFEPSEVFDQTSDLKKCEYCPYAQICMRS